MDAGIMPLVPTLCVQTDAAKVCRPLSSLACRAGTYPQPQPHHSDPWNHAKHLERAP